MTNRELRMTAMALLGFVGIMIALRVLTGGMSGFEGDGFEMDLPKDWDLVARPSEQLGIRFLAPAGGETPRPSIDVIYGTRETLPTLPEFFEEEEFDRRETVRRYKLRRHYDAEVDGLPAKRTIFTYHNLEDGVMMRSLCYYFVGGERVWAITCTAADAFFDDKLAMFDAIAKSFELE